MDKKIIDALIKFGLVTNICIDCEKYKDVDDLINKGVITIPGAKSTIDRLIKDINTDIKDETLNIEEAIIDTAPIEIINIEEAIEETVEEAIEETVEEAIEETVEEAIEETVEEAIEETVEEAIEETVEEAIEETVEEAIEETVEEAIEIKTKTNKRKSKKSE